MKLILCGGGWAEKTVIPNKLFETLIDTSKPILYIPLARNAGEDNYDSCKTWLEGEFQNIRHGEIVMLRSVSEIADKNVNDFTGVFIGGGNTYKLLKELKEGPAFDWLQEYIQTNGVIYGCSAGSIIFGHDIDACLYMDENNVALTDVKGFNSIFGFSFTAHYTNKNEEKTKKATDYLIEYSKKTLVLALPEEDSLYINGDLVKVIGSRPYYVFNKGIRLEFQPNTEYTQDEFIKQISNVQI
ncbi:MAG: Type 1 glutamine amidotransferase-like domain-containing protein [Alphaproteobacteria bacterium]|nr:Type 1 glutamine amidotransferase-like domain-containing protein [Alphaproteobacteria bacterium]